MMVLENVFYERNGKIVLKNINLKLEEGSLIEIYGKNGSGKSTLLKIISLIEKATRGKIIFNNIDISSFNDSKLAKIRLNYIGYVEQDYRLIKGNNVIESIMLPLILKKVDKKIAFNKAIKLIKDFGLEGLEYEDIDKLSGGERQRVCIASSIIKDPKLLVLDEPFSSQDETGEEIIRKLIRKFKEENKIIIFSSPYLIEDLPDKLYYIKDGTVITK
ncbi:MAG: ATP-binding cassette domain-containing protein [Candidatus Nanopusillus acidilobi]|jgi:ABC-type lipoprotein export system ATPase subunit